MEAIILGAALGAGVVWAARHGRKALRQAVGWTAETTGFITGQVRTALEDARKVARERYELGRADTGARTELGPPSSRANGHAHAAAHDGPPNGKSHPSHPPPPGE